MKKLFLLFSIAILVISCQITERVFIQESGAVKYDTEFDFSEMIGFIYTQSTKDSLRSIGEFPVDTIISLAELENFAQISPDSINDAQREFMKSLDKMKVRMVINDTEGIMSIGLEEKNIESFNAYLKKVKEATDKLEKEDSKMAEGLAQSGMLKTLEFKYDGKTFNRIAGKTKGFLDGLDDNTTESTKEMMNMFTYKLEYHFPKKIKKSNIENATYSLDGKTMTVEVPMMELIENPEKYNFQIEFE